MSIYKVFYTGYTGLRRSRPGKGVEDLEKMLKFSRNVKGLGLTIPHAYQVQSYLAEKLGEIEAEKTFFTEKDFKLCIRSLVMRGIITSDQGDDFLVIALGGTPEHREASIKKTEEPSKLNKSKEFKKTEKPADNDYELAASESDLFEKREADLARLERDEELRKMSDEI